jgi:uncharacterized Fe-S cluster protein YjdI
LLVEERAMSEEEEERKRAGVAREYTDERITVYWSPQYCIHTANCLNAEPEVFDAGRRPWVVTDAASADGIANAVMTCPTGALSFTRHDGGAEEPATEDVRIRPWPNGPLFLRGDVKIVDRTGEVTRQATRVALCRCSGSGNKPFCDGTHRSNGFRAP